MTHWTIYQAGLAAMIYLALAGWVLSLARDNVNHASSVWVLSIGMAAYCYVLFFYELHARTLLVLTLVSIWAIRLSIYLASRDFGKEEDFRYATMRKTQEPFFWLISILNIFGLQALCAWLISMPLFFAIEHNTPLNFFDYIGATLVIFGIMIESIADVQLAIFKQNAQHQNVVMQQGLWQYCRHPNYIGECCVWWGFYCIALAVNAWWSVISPILIIFLLFKWHGIPHIEKHMLTRYPEYRNYMQSTPAFLPNIFKK